MVCCPCRSADGGDQPILHRDLKSPNVLLTARPGSGEPVTCKVTDFGLSRDKQLESAGGQDTAMMTGCGSVIDNLSTLDSDLIDPPRFGRPSSLTLTLCCGVLFAASGAVDGPRDPAGRALQ